MAEELEITSAEEAIEALKKIDPEGKLPKPTPEETKVAYEEFAKAVSDFNSKSFEIGTLEKKNEVADYLLHFIQNRIFWTKQGWMGVIKLNEEIAETKNTSNDTPFVLGYQALEFTFFALTNVGGIGLQTALDMEKEATLYAEITDLVGKQLETARAELKEIQFLQEKWAAAEQGFYYEREPVAEDAPKENVVSMTLEDAEAELDMEQPEG